MSTNTSNEIEKNPLLEGGIPVPEYLAPEISKMVKRQRQILDESRAKGMSFEDCIKESRRVSRIEFSDLLEILDKL